jgi:hypothetical protein
MFGSGSYDPNGSRWRKRCDPWSYSFVRASRKAPVMLGMTHQKPCCFPQVGGAIYTYVLIYAIRPFAWKDRDMWLRP